MSEALDYTVPFRGELKAIASVGSSVALVTVHPEGRTTGLYWLHLGEDRPRSEGEDLAGGLALIADGESVWVAGSDGHIYRAPLGGKPKPVGAKFESAPKGLAPLANDRLAALVGRELKVLARKDGKVLQSLELPDQGTVLASDPSGRWLAAGSSGGVVAVFEAESSAEFVPSDSSRLHEGEVTALLFENDDLRFFSAGADLKLLTIHARGRLEPEDKGRGNNHADRVTAMIWGPGDRFFTGSLDGTVKSWPRSGGVKPVTQKDGVVKVVALAMVSRHGRDHLVVGCADNTVRTFALDAVGKPAALVLRGRDAMAATKDELAGDDPRAREAAIRRLAGFDDAASLELLAEQAGRDTDHGLRLLAAQLLGQSDHPRSPTLLEGLLKHAEGAVRTAAFEGLRRQRGPSDLRTLDLALKAEQPEIGRMAVEALKALATGDDQALGRLTSALGAKTPDVRQAALVALESAYPASSPEANLIALGTSHADVRRAALLRLLQRGLLGDPSAQSALRRRAEDADPDVRRVAFLLSLHTRPALLQALRSHDTELQRQLADLEGTAEAAAPEAPKKEKGKKAKVEATGEATDLGADDLAPLLQAAASLALDTSIRGARGLAVLGDPRAFGLLLQLSRVDGKEARVEVCRAMAALDDERAVERLRSLLFDSELMVRDAAFTALARLHEDGPLKAAEAGLNAPSENVRQRGLQLLVAEARKKAPKGPGDPTWNMLADALNDGFGTVRSEAFKSALNLKVGGGGPATLRFVMRSLHPDVRREALTEAMAVVDEPSGWDVLLEFLNDPDPALRTEAFAFTSKKSKGLEALDAALGSRYADLRKVAVEGLIKKRTAASQKLLVRALDDEDRDVRLTALGALVEADLVPALKEAAENAHANVRLRAARALSRHGDPAALAPLLALATQPEPEHAERKADWRKLVESALDGLAELGDPSPLDALIPMVASPHATVRQKAAQAMAWLTPADRPAPLIDALRHDDATVKAHAAFGLALVGDASAVPIVFSEPAAKVLSAGDRLSAALALAESAAGEGRLVAALDDDDEKARNRAVLLLLFQEWKDPRGTASRVLATLSSRAARARLVAAEALESLSNPAAFGTFLTRLVNDRGDKPPWTIPQATVSDLAELLVHAEPRLRARTAELLPLLDADEQAGWDQAWAAHSARFAPQLEALRGAASARKSASPDASPGALRELAFGAYVGLVREQGGSSKRAADSAVVRVRETALARLVAMAKSDEKAASAVRPVLVQALGDPNAAIRLPAFEALLSLGMSQASLAAEAIGTGHVDLGVKALEMLASGGTTAEGRRVLDEAMLTRRDDLATEAARLLIVHEGVVPVSGRALEAAHEPLRDQAVSWLAEAAGKEKAARDLLKTALASRYAKVREAAAVGLANLKDSAAFDALVALLKSAPKAVVARYLLALVRLGDPRAASAFVGRVEDDPSGTAPVEDLIRAAGQFRDPAIVDRLFGLWDKERKHGPVIQQALRVISGHDQTIEDPEDERPDRTWEQTQSPRRDDVLARLLARVTVPGEKGGAQFIPAARWSRSKAVDPVLAGLVAHSDEAVRRASVEAIGWRLRKRSGDPATLVKALASPEPVAQLLAAEGLAKAGRPEGLSVLLTSVEFVADLDLRRRAVLALGELADERAADLLIKLASEDGHALQETATEAIGHLGRSKQAEAVGRLLERHARGEGGLVPQAYRGLRWLNTASGWAVLRARAADTTAPYRWAAVEQLGHNDDPATRDLLLRLVRDDGAVADDALAAARELWGPESLEPDEALVQNPMAEYFDEFEEVMKRVLERSAPSRIFAILPRSRDEAVRTALSRAVMSRKPLPVAEANEALASAEAPVTGLAAHVLGRAGEAAKRSAPEVAAALARWWATWQGRRRDVGRAVDPDDDSEKAIVSCLGVLAWSAGRFGVGGETLVAMARAPGTDQGASTVRRAAVEALAASPAARKKAPNVLEDVSAAGEPDVRALAAQVVSADAPDRGASLADRLISDRVAFGRLARGQEDRLGDALRKAAQQVHYQGVALPYLINHKDLAGLGGVARDRSLPEGTRVGAIEALAAIATEEAEGVLRSVGLDEREDEDVRKAAWRCLRRSKRARARTGRRPQKTEVAR
jgi:ParB family chromosome partitioning protein